MVNQIAGKVLEVNKLASMCYVDLEQAFNELELLEIVYLTG